MLDIHTKGCEPYLTSSQKDYIQEVRLPVHCLKLHGRKNHCVCSIFFSMCVRKISHISSGFSAVYVMQCVDVGPRGCEDMAMSTAISDLPDRMGKLRQENHLGAIDTSPYKYMNHKSHGPISQQVPYSANTQRHFGPPIHLTCSLSYKSPPR